MIEGKSATLFLAGVGLLLVVISSGCIDSCLWGGLEEAKITDPTDGQLVKNAYTVHGTTKGDICEDSHLWLLVGIDSESQWWPQGGGSITPIDGKWSKSALFGGGPDFNIGEEFQIILLLVDEKVNEDLNSWVEKGKRTGDWPAMNLPSGKIFDKKDVTRIKG